jgi:hypothetical protein
MGLDRRKLGLHRHMVPSVLPATCPGTNN